MAELKYGTNYTSVKVKYAPGGASSINLAWEEPKVPIGSRLDAKNSEKRNAVQDPFKSREGIRGSYDNEDPNVYDRHQKMPQPINPTFLQNRDNIGHQMYKPVMPMKQEAYAQQPAFNDNYFHPKENALSNPYELQMPQQNYFKPPENEGNYFRNPNYNARESPFTHLGYASGDSYANAGNPGKEAFSPPSHNNFGNMNQQNINKEPIVNQPLGYQGGNKAYGLPPKYSNPSQPVYPLDAFSNNGGYREEKKYQPSYAGKNSVKVSNPPGGQSSIFFG
ncbi:hypothetical protein SteCoe_33866 [Stentor coeruleus]|uniref:Uncharacterized protein n=1 Tax=Stentor coeruleus TaxID=5963 RepID=A0A1R2AVS4_9CILI|nr:hypothetical protein SteCoe_33866 [Stentor coeruleus]